MVQLGVRESVSGKRIALDEDGGEERVCGGKGAVYLSGKKVALRCCGKATIVVTRRLKQSVLRQGDVGLLDVRDVFYANGTLTKYEVVDLEPPHKITMDANADSAGVVAAPRPASAGAVTTVAGLRVQATRLDGGSNASGSITSRFFARPQSADTSVGEATKGRGKQLSPQDVGDLEVALPVKKRSMQVVDDDDEDSDENDAVNAKAAASSKRQRRVVDDEASTPVKPRSRRSRVIIESDGDDDDDDGNDHADAAIDDGAVRSDVSSPMEEDDVYMRDLKLKQERSRDELLSFFDGNEEKKCAKIRKILAPFILRREKKYVLNQLVPKTVSVNMVQLQENQRKLYNDLVESVIKQKKDEELRKEEEKARKKIQRH
ncbi:hypothetical protein P43SY_002233 [Pythium insidiosum]|uniref:SNF2 N-terminal domain-containing protein n=1 Tax=Pythium insidiosum TaxID=114742 RepID=A0AAD5LPY6_PYTIN|nr:hypothetical protein P43SY_002233 [Pythium insidiosum]